VNVVDIGACCSLSRRILHSRDGHEQKQGEKQRAKALQISSRFSAIWMSG
jgi:hypothetical protein